MKVALLYPPPWKVAEPGGAEDPNGDGPPPGYRHGDLDADFYQIPYGLLQLGAEALRAGHAVKVLNLSNFTWTRVLEVVRALDADVVGMSCWTANRRGVDLVARAIKLERPETHVVVGGPHASPLAKEVLTHFGAVDSVAVGEADHTFVELLGALADGRPLAPIRGLWSRDPSDREKLHFGGKRESVAELDTLAMVHRTFATHILMTSRGCPWACTFCGAETTWGRGFRSQSIDYVLDALESALEKLPVRMIQIKDDTFTTNKKRVLALCRRIRERKLDFFWSCDTRVDLLTDELLREMRLAGCQRLSLGVESGSQTILDAIDKKITVGEIARTNELCKRYGIKVRFYMMLGNRGETRETFRETLDFLEVARPHEYIFSCLSVYPGTRDFHEAERRGWLSPSVYFEQRFQEFKTTFDAEESLADEMNAWFREHSGLQTMYRPTLEDFEQVLAAVPESSGAHMDVAGAAIERGQWDKALAHLDAAAKLRYPCPGLLLNHRAVIAARTGDYETMMAAFTQASRIDPQHFVLIRNINQARAWFKADGPKQKLPLELEARHDFQLLERTLQPTLPGPLPADLGPWLELPESARSATFARRPSSGTESASEFEEAEIPVKTPELEGSKAELRPKGKLHVLS